MHGFSLETTLAHDISVLCCSEQYADICIIVGDARIPAHSLILAARSPVFATMFRVPMKETISKEVVLEDIEVSVVRVLLQYVYSGSVDASCDNTCLTDLLRAAKRFGMSELEKLVLQKLCTDGFQSLLQVSCRV